MRIKVVTAKDLVKYIIKICIVFGIIAMLTKFFYSRKNVNNYFSFNSRVFLATLKEEILLLKEDELSKKNFNTNGYVTGTIDSELSMFKSVAATNISTITLANDVSIVNNENINTESNETEQIQNNVPTNVNVEVMPSNIPDKSTYEIFGVKLRNESDYNLSAEITDLNVDFNKNDILIFHTHTCESYTQTEQYKYESTGNFRTTDLNYTVARVGDELEKNLTGYGYTVVHDKSYHDYPAYNGSYNRSLVTVENLLEKYANTDVVIDLHRDAIGDNTYAPKVKIGDEYCARIMLVIGTDGGGLTHKNWRDNLKFAIKLAR